MTPDMIRCPEFASKECGDGGYGAGGSSNKICCHLVIIEAGSLGQVSSIHFLYIILFI